jgi:hypothetical protein
VASSALFVTRGAKLNAIGTVSQPIVFTSKNAIGSRNRGDWGGIVLLGKGIYNVNNGENYIEGISQTVNTQFGGGLSPITNDNSGTLKYVRIEFAGYVFSPNNELNGLTMGACGSGTTVDYVQVSYSNDDSFEWFGGSVNCKHLVALNGLDDDFDTDNGYNGIVQFALSVRDPLAADISTSECFESDNNAGGTSVAPFTSAIFTNVTAVGPTYRSTLSGGSPLNGLYDRAARLRRATKLKVFNSLFLDFKRGLHIDGSVSEGFAVTNDELKWENNIIASSYSPNTPLVNTAPATIAWYGANNNTSLTTSTGILTLPYNTSAQNYTSLDHRPGSGSVAETGATFTDGVFSGILSQVDTPQPIVTTPIIYCKGAVAAPLLVVSAPGTTLRWYTSATIVTFSTTTPVVTTTTVGNKSFWVAQVNTTTGVVSNRVEIVVTTLTVPAVALGTITNGDLLPAIAAIGAYVGITTPITYSVPASAEFGVTSYFWTVPLGTTIISGQGTTSLTVHFNNVPAGAGAYGSIGVQAENGNGCRGALKTLALTKALPAATAALKMTDASLPIPITGIPTAVTSFAKYMGTSTPLTLTATVVPVASSYVWEIPTGVNIDLGTAGTPTIKLYATYPFTNTIASAPTANGNVYYRVTETVYSNGITIQTATKTTVGGAINVVVTNLTNEGATINPAFPIVFSTSPVISINFLGVTSSNTFNYMSTAAVPVSTNSLRLGVKSKNGVGVSLTSNAALINPTTTSTAKLLTLTAVKPAAPTPKMTNDAISTSVAVTDVSKSIGTLTEFTLTASVSVLASSYEWSLPAGVNVIFGNPSSDRIIKVNFLNVTSDFDKLYIGVRAINGIGSSDSSASNTLAIAPYTNSPFKLLKLKATVPAAISIVAGQLVGLCGFSASPYAYTITPTPLANFYTITAPAGSLVTSASNSENISNVLTTSDLTFNVTYPEGFVVTRTTAVPDKTIVITSVNGVGNSITSKSLTLASAMAAVASIGGGTTYSNCDQTFTTSLVAGTTIYTWTVPVGATIVSGQGTNTVIVNYGSLTGNQTIKVMTTNVCGASSAVKSLTLIAGTCPTGKQQEPKVKLDSNISLYPNPTKDVFNIELNADSDGEMTMTIYNINGSKVMTRNVQLNKGNNVIAEDVASLTSGVYFIQIYNTTTNETISKKLIKN